MQGKDLCSFLSLWVLGRDKQGRRKKRERLGKMKDVLVTDRDEKTVAQSLEKVM